MNRTNFDAVMESELSAAPSDGRLLMHCCCAPCSTACLMRAATRIRTDVLFYNPNIVEEEYARRKAELIRFLNETRLAGFIDCDGDFDSYRAAVAGLENEREGGARCAVCFKLRLEKTAETAERLGYGYFTTTLTVSPLKDAMLINEIGESCAKGRKTRWLHCDFKKRGGYLESVRLSQEHSLYRQDFCGCVYSEREAEARRAARANTDKK